MVPKRGRDIGWQIISMKNRFPDLEYRSRCWIGYLQPYPNFDKYKVKIVYRGQDVPKVFLLNPPLVKNPKHIYQDNSLCIYFPQDWKWNENEYITETIVPWTYVWLYFYEIWLETGTWYGEEAPHRGKKKSE
jgi:hypothetical protein